MVRRLTALAVLVPALTVMSAPGAGPSVAAETTVSVEGRGFGHGIGMSQWGAYGYAVDQGWTAGQILDHYYGGTVAGTAPLDTTVTVRLQRLDDAQTAVVNEAGRLVVDGVTGGPWRSVLVREVSAAGQPVAYSVWARSDQQVCPPASGDPVASGWTLVAPSVATKVDVTTNLDTSAATSFADLPAVCEPTTGVVRSYRGTIRAVNGTAGENRTVNVVPVEQYLRSVVAKEMSPSWASAGGGRGAQALQVQAVAARSYALAENRYSYARTCDTTSCQAYFGVASRTSVTAPYVQVEYPSTDAAVAAVAGVVRRVGTVSGQIAYTMYSASSGGYTAPGGGGLLPFPAVPDVGDSTTANPNRSWTTSLTGSQITAKYPTIGSFTAVSVEARNGFGDWGGRATSIKVQGSLGSVTVTGDQFRIAFGLKSTWIRFVGTVVEPDPCDGRVAPPVTGALGASAASMFNPVTPVRLIDTRAPGIGTAPVPLGAGCTMVVDPDLPATATALTVNVASIRPAVNGFLAVYPCGTARPTVSGLQALAGRTVAAAGTVTLGADGTFCIYSSITTNLIVDHFGWYGTASGVNFQPVTTTRLIDTRSRSTRLAAGTVLTVPVVRSGGAPAGATATAVTVHATSVAADGFVTVYPCAAARPTVSTVNATKSTDITNHVQVALDGAGQMCVYVSSAMHITVDMSGWFGSAATTRYYAVPPYRSADTRIGQGLGSRLAAGANRAVVLAPSTLLPSASTVRAIIATVTAVNPGASGYLTVHPCQSPVPGVSMVRYAASRNSANTVIGIDDASGRWCIYASAATDILVDVNGYFA